MGRCKSCGAEDVTTQDVLVGREFVQVCARCYLEIEKNKAEIEKNKAEKERNEAEKNYYNLKRSELKR